MVQLLDGADVKGNKVTNVATATNPGDGVNLAQLNAAILGGDLKQSVRVATTANITLSGLTAINGYTPVAGDRILVKNQTDATQNGIWIAASSAWTRAADAAGTYLTPGALVAVEQGTTDPDTTWLLTSDDPFTVGTSNQTWSKAPGTGQAYSAGYGIQIISGVISVLIGAGLIADGTNLRLDPNSTVFGRHRSYNVPAGTNPKVTHDLNSTQVNGQLWDISGAYPVVVGIELRATGLNEITVPAGTVAANQYRLDLIG